MKTQQFLEHHGVGANPFAEEDAQTDPVFRDHCISSAYHPTWDKIYGDPATPATSIVFGEKGAGKTAMRLQIVRHLSSYNASHPEGRVWIIEYDDFNPFLDRFRAAVRRKRSDRVLGEWKLWDHMDAILSLGVTGLVDRLLSARGADARPGRPEAIEEPLDARRLDAHQARDLLLLAACYDQSSAETTKGRWRKLRRKLRFRAWPQSWRLLLGIAVSIATPAAVIALHEKEWLASVWPYLLILAGWLPWLARLWRRFWQARAIVRNVRVGRRETWPLTSVLMNFSGPALVGQPLPAKPRTDDRYELLSKFQSILQTLGYRGIVVLVDRVDEPHLINGSVDQMRALLWPMLDNKFLKHQGIGFKLLLPIELSQFIDREDRDFYQRARLDKQNMIPSLEWTGEALYDVALARVRACALPGQNPSLREMFDESVSERRLMDAFRGLRVPRHLFKFLYRLFAGHCNAYTDEAPCWRVTSERFESTLALYSRDQDAFDRGVKAG